jgi:hypothetical protein
MLNKIKTIFKKHPKIIIGIMLISFISSLAYYNLSRTHGFDMTMLKNQMVDNLAFSETKFNNNTLEVIVQNTTSSDYNLKLINVSFKNGDETITTIPGYIGDRIQPGGYKKLVVTTDVDLTNAKSVSYEIIK